MDLTLFPNCLLHLSDDISVVWTFLKQKFKKKVSPNSKPVTIGGFDPVQDAKEVRLAATGKGGSHYTYEENSTTPIRLYGHVVLNEPMGKDI